MGISRRRFLHGLGLAGGYGAAYAGLTALGLHSTAHAQDLPTLPPGAGKGRTVAILGAGIAGLVVALELERAGFDVTLLEARDRVGGRNWTVRGGDRIEMAGESDQTAAFSKGLYFNAGPARIPSHHQGLLGYARRLGVPLEVEVNSSRSTLLRSDLAFGGKPIQQRQAINDLRGQLSALLAKAARGGALDRDLSAEDRERLVAFLKGYGDLGADLRFNGTERSGYTTLPGAADQVGVARAPLPMRELLKSDTLAMTLYDENILMQPTMFQPVGGMDRIPVALAAALRRRPVLDAEVASIRHAEAGARVTYRDRRSGRTATLAADYLIVTVPLPVLARIDTDFSPAVKRAIAGAVYTSAAKVAFETPRFWEAEQIYGGLSFPGGETGLVWYPSGGFQADRGVLVGAYTFGTPAQTFERRPLGEQIAMARGAVDGLHPGHGAGLSRPVVVDWNKVPFTHGPWIHWEDDGNDLAAYRLLNQPEGRVYFSGAHLSQLPSWQEGAVVAAHRTVLELVRRVQAG